MIETIRLSQQAKENLIKVKRKTGIKNWNVLCRWAFCLSLTDPSLPEIKDITTDSSVEMTWKTFGGKYYFVYQLMFAQYYYKNNKYFQMDEASFFKLVLHRGINLLVNVDSIDDFFNKELIVGY